MSHSRPRTGCSERVNLYQRLTSHRRHRAGTIPSCSEYAREAVEMHGAARGSLAARPAGWPLPPARAVRVRPGSRQAPRRADHKPKDC